MRIKPAMVFSGIPEGIIAFLFALSGLVAYYAGRCHAGFPCIHAVNPTQQNRRP